MLSVGVVIPAYKAAATIGRAVDSVLAQSSPADEIIVVDDGSPDDLPSALKPYGDRVRYLRQSNAGASAARNLGIDASSSDLIAFLDADDYWEPDKLKTQRDVMKEHPAVGFVAAQYYNQTPGQPRTLETGARVPAMDRPTTRRGRAAFDLAMQAWTGTVVLRRSALGQHRFDPSLSIAEDRDLWLRMVDGRPSVMLSKPLATAVLERGSLSRSSADVGYSHMIRVLRRHAHRVGGRSLRRMEADVYRAWAGQHLSDGRPDSALPPAWERLRRQPLSPQGWRIVAKCYLRARASGSV